MLSGYSFLALAVAPFYSFLSLLSFFLLSSLFTFVHFLHLSILLLISCVIHDFADCLSTFLFESHYLAHISSYCFYICVIFHHLYLTTPIACLICLQHFSSLKLAAVCGQTHRNLKTIVQLNGEKLV